MMGAAGGATSRRRPWFIAAAATLLASVVAWTGTQLQTPAEVAARTEPPPPSVVTATVATERLVEEIRLTGAVVPPERFELDTPSEVPAGAGRGVVTGVMVARGQELRPGDLIAEFSGRPLMVLPGSIPSYRELRPGLRGDDVLQLQKALNDLGFAAGSEDGRFGAGTAAALRRWYASHGYEVVTVEEETEPEETAKSSPADAAEPNVEVAVDESTASDAEPAPPDPPPSVVPATPKVVEVPVLPLGEVEFVPTLPAPVVDVPGAVGAATSTPLVALEYGDPVVELELDVEQRQVVAVGQAVDVHLPSGESMPGTVLDPMSPSLASPSADADEAGDAEEAGDAAEATPDAGTIFHVAVPGLAGGQVAPDDEVTVVVRRDLTDGEVLVVPLSAVWADADGAAFVLRTEEDGLPSRIAVELGPSTGGRVAVEVHGDNLLAGDEVVVSTASDAT